MVVVAPTNILVGDAGAARLDVERGSAIKSVLKDGSDVSIGARADTEGALARCLDTIRSVLLRKTEHSQARAVAVLWVSPFGEKALGKPPGVDADVGGPAEHALWGPLSVLLMSEWHMCGDGRMAPQNAAPHMRRFAASEPENLDGGDGGAKPQLFAS